ncbi:MAG: flavin-containing monooxygenase [Actinomycetales bacterium]
MDNHHDVIVIGAGFAGIYAIHSYRDRLGMSVQAFDAADDVGGTWYWNRYPGARVDIESVHYSYSFDPDLEQEWHWTEKFAAQPEILAYLNHCADRYDIRRSVQFGTRVVEVTWDDQADHWIVLTDRGERHTAQFFVSGAGTLSVPKKPDFPGVENFTGQVLLTGNWTEDHDLTGRRVGLIGVGSSGIQAISEISKCASQLTVFQRTPNYATPIGNCPSDPRAEAEDKARYRDLREASRNHFLGVPYRDVQPSALTVSAEERASVYQDRWDRGGFRLFIDSFADVLLNKTANDTAADFIRDKIRQRVDDPATAELLCPTDYPYGTKRPPLETDYYEAYNRPTTTLVDVKTNPIAEVTRTGVRLADGTHHEFDVLVLATGFDACTGPLLAMNVTGRGGLALTDAWAQGPQTYLGLTVAGFPNLFIITGPQSPSVLYNMPLAIEDHVDLIGDLLSYMAGKGHRVVEATEQAQDQWVCETNALAEMTLLPEAATTWYMGANIPGKPRRVLVYLGGAPRYRAICDNVQRNDYRGFVFAQTTAELAESSSSPALDPSLMFLVEALRKQGFAGFRDAGVEGARAAVDGFTAMQSPTPEGVTVTEDAYGDGPQQVLRIYRPDAEGALPMLIYVHGGGFVAGGLDVVAEPAADLAARTGCLVVTPTYRRAPEHVFPAAHDDIEAALAWVADHVEDHGGDPQQIVLAGDSAGGMLASSAAVAAIGSGLRLSGLVLIYPWLSVNATETASRREFDAGYVIEGDDLEWFASTYLPRVDDRTDPRVSLDLASLAGLPPTLIITNECDPLRDEAEDLAVRMRTSGVDAVSRHFPGLAHGVFWMSLAVPRAAAQREAVAEFVRTRVQALQSV